MEKQLVGSALQKGVQQTLVTWIHERRFLRERDHFSSRREARRRPSFLCRGGFDDDVRSEISWFKEHSRLLWISRESGESTEPQNTKDKRATKMNHRWVIYEQRSYFSTLLLGDGETPATAILLGQWSIAIVVVPTWEIIMKKVAAAWRRSRQQEDACDAYERLPVDGWDVEPVGLGCVFFFRRRRRRRRRGFVLYSSGFSLSNVIKSLPRLLILLSSKSSGAFASIVVNCILL